MPELEVKEGSLGGIVGLTHGEQLRAGRGELPLGLGYALLKRQRIATMLLGELPLPRLDLVGHELLHLALILS